MCVRVWFPSWFYYYLVTIKTHLQGCTVRRGATPPPPPEFLRFLDFLKTS